MIACPGPSRRLPANLAHARLRSATLRILILINEVFRNADWTGRPALVLADDRVVPCSVASEPEWLNGEVGRLTLMVTATASSQLDDYRNATKAEVDFGDAGTTLVTGFIDEVEWSGRRGTIVISSPLLDLADLQSGGFASSRVPPMEVFWSMMRLAGWPASRLNMHGMRIDTLEMFAIVTAVDGVVAPELFNVGSVLFSADPRLAAAQLPAADDRLVSAFRSGPVWASTSVRGRLALEAIEIGVRRIDAALAWLMVSHGCGAPVAPNSERMPFQRALIRGRPRRSGAVYAEGISSRRLMLHGENTDAERPLLGPSPVNKSYVLPQEPRENLMEAALCWRRSSESREQFAVVSALSEAVECLTAELAPPKLFSRSELRRIRQALPQDLTEEQNKRLSQVVGFANRPSLRLKLEELLGSLGMPYRPKDLDAFQQVRDARNDFVHGRGRQELDPLTIELASSFVARLIMWAGAAAA